MQKSRLITELRGEPGGTLGLLAILKKAAKKLYKVPGNQSTLLSGPTADTVDSHPNSPEIPFTQFQRLIQMVRNACHYGNGRKAQTKIDFTMAQKAILLAYRFQSDQTLECLLSESSNAMQAIGKLSRYWCYCMELLRYARSMAALRKIEFFAIPTFDIRQPPMAANPNVISTVHHLLSSMGFTRGDLEAYCKHTRLREGDLWSGMQTSLRTPPRVHAEISLVYFYALHTDLQPEVEIGFSKHPCFACHHFLKHHPLFKIGKSYTGVYPGWALPNEKASSSSTTLVRQIILAFIGDLRQNLIRVLTSAPHVQIPPDSSTGITTKVGDGSVNRGDTFCKNGKSIDMGTKGFVEGMRAFVCGLGGLAVRDDLEDVGNEDLCKTENDIDEGSIPGCYPGKPDSHFDLPYLATYATGVL